MWQRANVFRPETHPDEATEEAADPAKSIGEAGEEWRPERLRATEVAIEEAMREDLEVAR